LTRQFTFGALIQPHYAVVHITAAHPALPARWTALGAVTGAGPARPADPPGPAQQRQMR